MHSVRNRLLLVLTLGFAVLLVVAGILFERVVNERVTDEFDAALLAKAQTIASLTEQEGVNIMLDYEDGTMPEFERDEEPEYFEIYLDTGLSITRSARIGKDQHLAHDAPASTPVYRDTTLPDGRAGRTVQLTFQPEVSDDAEEESGAPAIGDQTPLKAPDAARYTLLLVVGRGRGHLDELLAHVRLAFFGVGGLAIALGVLLVWRAVATGFRPLDAIVTQVQGLDAEHLSRRVHLPRAPRELAPIVHQLNALLDRLGGSFERERRFTGNVAHELRTPIAELRALAEVGAKWPDDQQSVVQFFGDVHDVAGRMEGLVSDLLLLARCQSGVEPVTRSMIDLHDVVATTWSHLRQALPGDAPEFTLECERDVVVESDASKLEIILSNLIGNAVQYARPGTRIRCIGARTGARFRLEISNQAEPLAKDDLEKLTEPFWRKDEARSSSDHVGLGLSVVAALADLLDLGVSFEQDRDGLFHARVEGAVVASETG